MRTSKRMVDAFAPAFDLKALKIDPNRILEPGRKNLTTLESQKVLAVLDESIRRCRVVAALPDILENLEKYNILFGRELMQLLEKFHPVYQEYEDLSLKIEATEGIERSEEKAPLTQEIVFDDDFWTRPRSELSNKSSKSTEKRQFTEEEVSEFENQIEENEARLNELKPHLQFMIRCILLAFRTNPSALTAITEQISDWSIQHHQGTPLLLHELMQIRETLRLRLLTTPSEHQEKMDILREITTRQNNHQGTIEKLEEELLRVQEHHDLQVKNRNDHIRRLQGEIHQVEQFDSENRKRIKFEADKQKSSDEKNSESRMVRLEQELTQKRNELANAIQEHRDSEEKLRRKKWKLETDVDTVIHRYDAEMSEKQSEFEDMDDEYTKEKQQLHELEERFATLEVEYKQIMEERRIAEEKQRIAEAELQLLIKSAITIQSFWRSYKARKMLRGKKKGGAKKK